MNENKRMNKKLIGGVIVGVLAIALIVGIATASLNKPAVERSNITEGHFLVVDGVVQPKVNEDNEAVVGEAPVTVDIYFDSMCGSCGVFGQDTSSLINGYLTTGKIDIVYHPVAFVATTDVTPHSTVGGAYALAMAEYAPEVTHRFIDFMVNRDFQETVQEDVNSYIESLDEFVLALTDEETLATVKGNYKSFYGELSEATRVFTKGADVKALSPSGQVGTPFVTVNKKGETDAMALEFLVDTPMSNTLKNAIEAALAE